MLASAAGQACGPDGTGSTIRRPDRWAVGQTETFARDTTMNKADLIEEVQKNLGTECSKSHAEKVVNSVLASISRGLKKDREVQLVGFGTFAVKNRKARMGRNPQTNEPIHIKASRTGGFRCRAG